MATTLADLGFDADDIEQPGGRDNGDDARVRVTLADLGLDKTAGAADPALARRQRDLQMARQVQGPGEQNAFTRQFGNDVTGYPEGASFIARHGSPEMNALVSAGESLPTPDANAALNRSIQENSDDLDQWDPTLGQRFAEHVKHGFQFSLPGQILQSVEAGPAASPQKSRNRAQAAATIKIAKAIGHAPDPSEVRTYYRKHPDQDRFGALGNTMEAQRLGAFAGASVDEVKNHFQKSEAANEKQLSRHKKKVKKSEKHYQAMAGSDSAADYIAATVGELVGTAADPALLLGAGPESAAGKAIYMGLIGAGETAGLSTMAQKRRQRTGLQKAFHPEEVGKEAAFGAAAGAGLGVGGHAAAKATGKIVKLFRNWYAGEHGVSDEEAAKTLAGMDTGERKAAAKQFYNEKTGQSGEPGETKTKKLSATTESASAAADAGLRKMGSRDYDNITQAEFDALLGAGYIKKKPDSLARVRGVGIAMTSAGAKRYRGMGERAKANAPASETEEPAHTQAGGETEPWQHTRRAFYRNPDNAGADHEQAVNSALKAGKKVRPDVLVDYPHLIEEYGGGKAGADQKTANKERPGESQETAGKETPLGRGPEQKDAGGEGETPPEQLSPEQLHAETVAALRRAEGVAHQNQAHAGGETQAGNHRGEGEIQEVPVDRLSVSDEVPQFKAGANSAGVVEPLGGQFDRRGVGPIQVWRRNNGDMEVVSGRHRLDLARRSGEKTVPAQVYDESAGFDRQQAASLDAELNIRDGQGQVADYVQYFQRPAFQGEKGREAAESRGLLARATGRRAFAIARQATPETIAAHRGGAISDQAAVRIAEAVPDNTRLQTLGLKQLQQGHSIADATNTMRAVSALGGDRGAESGDLFGGDASGIRDAEAMAKAASAKQRAIGERLAAVTGAAKRPDVARAEGVDVNDPEALDRRIEELRAEKNAWDNWQTDPAKAAELKSAVGMETPPDTTIARINEPGHEPGSLLGSRRNAPKVEVPDNWRAMTMRQLARTARDYARKHFAGTTVRNRNDGSDIVIPWQGIKHALSGIGSRNVAYAARDLGAMIENAEPIGTTTDRSNRDAIRAIHYYEAQRDIDGQPVTFNIVVREHPDGRRFYDHYEIKSPDGASGDSQTGRSHQPSSGRGRTDLEQTITRSDNGDPGQNNISEQQLELDLAGTDPYDHSRQGELFTARPDTTGAEKETGRAAIKALEARVFGRGRRQASVLGLRLLAGYRAKGANALTGQTITSPEDLATLAQVYRDPRFETFRVLFTRDGRVVGENAYTSRMPGAVRFDQRVFDRIGTDKQRFGADGYWLLHNHPSGNPKPSQADLGATERIAGEHPGFQGHVIVDHNRYAEIGVFGKGVTARAIPTVFDLPGGNDAPTAGVAGADTSILGATLRDPETLAIYAKQWENAQAPVFIVTDTQSKVQAILTGPLSFLTHPKSSKRNVTYMRRLMRETGSGGHLFAVVPKAAWDKAGDIIERNAAHGRYRAPLADILTPEGSLTEKGSFGVEPDIAPKTYQVAEPGQGDLFGDKGFQPTEDMFARADEREDRAKREAGARAQNEAEKDLLDDNVEAHRRRQTLADEQRRRDQQRSPATEVPADTDGGLFANQSGDIEDAIARLEPPPKFSRASGEAADVASFVANDPEAPSAEDLAEARRQIDEVKRRHASELADHDNGESLKAPNGRPSKLNRGQWIAVRTPRFHAWFGSWDIAAATPQRTATNFVTARRAANTFKGKPLTNYATGMKAVVSRNSLDKMLSRKAVNQSESPADHALAVANLDDLFQRAHFGWTKPDAAGEPTITGIHRFFAPLVHDGQARLAKLTVKETARRDQPNPLYTVESVELNETSPAASWVDSTVRFDGIDPTSIRSARDIHNLAQRVQNFNPDDVSKVVDANGEPLLVYHGTKASIESFSPQKARATHAGLYGNGFYFTYDPEEASRFAIVDNFGGEGGKPNVIPAFVDIKNPYKITMNVLPNGQKVSDFHPNHIISNEGGKKIREMAENGGHDGIILANDHDKVLHAVAFSPEQIKSAIGNAGTYGDTGRIDFSRGRGERPERPPQAEPPGEQPPTEQDRTDVDQLNAALNQYLGRHGADARATAPVPSDSTAIAAALAKAFGKRTVFFTADDPQISRFNGITLPGKPDTVYLNARADVSANAVLGHELTHHLKAERPDLWQPLYEAALVHMRNSGEYADWLNRAMEGEGGSADEALLHEEMIADYIGDQFLKPEFWRAVMDHAPDEATKRGLAQTLRAFLDRVLHHLRQQGFGSSRYFRDAEHLRGVAADAFARYGARDAETPLARGEYAAAARAVPAGEVWHSAMRQTLTDKLPNQGPAKMLAANVRAQAKKGQIKAEELEWSGLAEWLDGQKGTVTKDAVLGYLDAHAPKLETQVLGEGYGDFEVEPVGGDTWEASRGGEFVGRFEFDGDYDDALAVAEREFAGERGGDNTRYSEYTLPGGENYRELLIRLGGDTDKKYRSSHFDRPNILAHLRVDERTDADGGKTLFLEEAQSDWHQEGRKKGYRVTPGGESPETVRDFFGIDKALWDRLTPAEREAYIEEYRSNEPHVLAGKRRQAPDAPFKKTWPLLAMKRAIRYAVDNGHDRIAWTTGAHQSARYDLSAQIDRLRIEPWRGDTGTRRYDVTAYRDGNIVLQRNGGDDKELAGLIGHELAERAQALPEEKAADWEGLDLTTGGEGMKAFYDTMLPKIVGKYVKKWGAKPARATIDTPGYEGGDTQTVHAIDITPEMRAAAKAGQPMFSRSRAGVRVRVPREWRNMKIGPLTAAAKRYAQRKFAGRTVTNAADKTRIEIPWQGIKHALSGQVSREAAYATHDLPRLIETARPVRVEADAHMRPDIKAVHIYRADPIIEGEPTAMEIVVREHNDGRRFYDHYTIKNPGGLSGATTREALRAPASSGRDTSVPDDDSNDNTPRFSRAGQPGRVPGGYREGRNRLISRDEADQVTGAASFDGERWRVIVSTPDGLGYGVETAGSRADAESILKNHGTVGTEGPPEQTGFAAGEVAPPDSGYLGRAAQWLQYKAQDKFNALRRVQSAAEAGRGEKLADRANPYQEEELHTGRARSQMDDFDAEQVQPLLDRLQHTGFALKAIGEYAPDLDADLLDRYGHLSAVDAWLYARHAPEANARLEQINPGEPAKSGMSDEDAARILDTLAGHGERAAFAYVEDWVQAVNAATRAVLADTGLESRQLMDEWAGQYDHYVPLKGEPGGPATDRVTGIGARRGRGMDTRGPHTQRRLGRDSPAQGILANVVAGHYSTIQRGAKNAVAQAMLRFAQENPSPLWEIDTPMTARTLDPATGLVVKRGDPSQAQKDNVFGVRVNGIDHFIHFDEHSVDAMRIAQSLKNMGDTQMGTFLKALHHFNSYLSLMSTGANPEFLISNFSRDIQEAAINLNDTQAHNLKWRIMRDTLDGKAWRAIRAHQRGRADHDWAGYVDDFLHDGGSTGWMEGYDSVDAFNKALTKRLDRQRPGSWAFAKRSGHNLFEYIHNINHAAENGVRLAAYIHAREAGVSRKQAASLAKNLTVNFNRKGEAGNALNALYLFYNASVQGNARILRAAVRSPKARRFMYGVVGLGAAQYMANYALSGDNADGTNRYEAVPGYIKRNNWVIMLPDGDKLPDWVPDWFAGDGYFKFPMPYGYNVLNTAGQAAGKAMLAAAGVVPDYDPGAEAVNVALGFANGFNPLGGDSDLLQLLSPTVTDPIVQWDENKNFAGIPIHPEPSPFVPKPPAYTLHFSGARAWSKALTKELNMLSGGTQARPGAINLNPEMLDHFTDFFAGGVGRFVGETANLPFKVKNIIEGGAKIDAYQIPFLGKVWGTPREGASQNLFYNRRTQMRYLKQEYKKARKQGDRKHVMALRRDYPGQTQLLGQMHAAERQLRQLSQAEDGIKASDALSDDQKSRRLDRLRDRKQQIYHRFNRRYHQVVVEGGAPDLRKKAG